MAKINRVVDNASLQDPLQIKSVEYNPQSGGEKSLIVGPKLIPIPIVTAGNPTWTTNVAAATAMPYLGALLAIYNNAGAVASVTIGQTSSVTSQAVGAVDSSGNVGIALPPNTYTYVSMGYNRWIISSAATVIVYIIEDPTMLAQESSPYAQQNAGNTQPIS